MDKDQFISTAKMNVSAQAIDRMSLANKFKILAGKTVFDTHCHIFDADCIDPKYFLIRTATGAILGQKSQIAALAPHKNTHTFSVFKPQEVIFQELAESTEQTLSAEKEWAQIEAELVDIQTIEENSRAEKFVPEGGFFGVSISGIIDALRILRRNKMSEVLDLYRRKYAVTNLNRFPFQEAEFFSTALMMDFKKGWPAARVKKSMADQILELRSLAKTENLLPFLFVDPRREEAGAEHLYEVFLKAFAPENDLPPFCGIKVYPAMGYSPSDYRLFPIWEICEALNIPVLTHCGGNMISTFDETITVRQCTGDNPNSCNIKVVPGNNRKDRASWLNQPEHWRPVLQKHPKLRLNLAHFGGGNEWQLPTMGQKSTEILDLISNYENVYADFSFNLVNQTAVDNFTAKVVQDPLMQQKCLFGTDYWVVLPDGNLNDGQRHLISKLNNSQLVDQLFCLNPKKWLGLP